MLAMLGDQDEEVSEYEQYVEDLEDLGRLHSKVIDLGRLRGSLWVFTEKRSLSGILQNKATCFV